MVNPYWVCKQCLNQLDKNGVCQNCAEWADGLYDDLSNPNRAELIRQLKAPIKCSWRRKLSGIFWRNWYSIFPPKGQR